MLRKIKIFVVLILLGGIIYVSVYKQNDVLAFLGLPNKLRETEEVEQEYKKNEEEKKNEDVLNNAFGLTPTDSNVVDNKVNNTNDSSAERGSYEERIEKGLYYTEEGFLDFAMQEFSGAIAIKPNRGEAYFYLGRVQFQNKDYEHASENLKKALKKGYENLEAGILLVRTLIEADKFNEAKLTLEEIDDGSENIELLYVRALIQILNNNRSVAGGSLAKIIELYPESEIAAKAQLYLDAYHEFDFFQDGKPAHLRALLAKALIQNEEYALATELLRQVISASSDYRDAWVLMGYAHYARGEQISALNAWEKAVEIDPTHAESQYFLGLAYTSIDEFDKAIVALKSALENNFEPRGQVVSKLADVYLTIEEYRLAVQTYEDYLKLGGKNNVENYVRPIWIYLDFIGEDGIKDALRLANQSVELFPESALAHNLLGWVYIYDEKYSEAFEQLDKARKLDPDLAAVYLNFGRLYEAQGKTEQAKEVYRTAYSKGAGTSIGNLAAEKYNKLLSEEQEQ